MILNYIYFIILLFVIDLIWISQPIHKSIYSNIQKSPIKINITAAVLFYLLAPLGFFIFIRPICNYNIEALYYGCIMGFLMYMTYDLTNKTIFTNYNWNYVIYDVTWGTFLYGFVSFIISYLILNKTK